MTAGAGHILMAGIADLYAFGFNLIRVCECHVFRVRQIVAGAIVAKRLAMAVVAFLFLGISHISVLDCPLEIRM